MKGLRVLSGVVGVALNVWLQAVPALAQDILEPSLIVSQFKVTSSNGQFFELQNNSAEPIDMSGVQLAYYNHYDVSKATSSKLISLSGILEPGGFYLVNDGSTALCYQVMVASASLSFSSTTGMVQVHKLEQSVPGGPISSSVVDSVAWSRTAVAGAQTLPANTSAFLKRQWPDGLIKSAGGGSWLTVQPSATDPCQLESVLAPLAPQTLGYSFAPGVLPPVRYVAAPVESEKLVNRNVGKMAPIINEVLPNPSSPQTDSDDEFIELYNPNDSVFDLSGFKLAFGSTNPRKYTFPEGTLLEPKSFKTFTSGDTSISLSNSLAQIWLLDPNEGVISQTEPYSKAPNGQAWALDRGSWKWTAVPTPQEVNAISSTPVSGSGNNAAAVLGINSATTQTPANSPSGSAQTGQSKTQQDAAPLHPGILAGVGLLAVGYALYEYRQDMANRIFQFRRYLRNRRAARQVV